MGMRFLRKYSLELIAAAIVLIILLCVMFPRFQQAQILHQVAHARADLARIGRAMIAYRLNQGAPLQFVSIEQGTGGTQTKPYSIDCAVNIAAEINNATTKNGSRSRIHNLLRPNLPSNALLPYIGSYPIPFMPLKTERDHIQEKMYLAFNYEWGRKSGLLTRQYSYLTSLASSLNPNAKNSEYVGFSAGPYLEIHPLMKEVKPDIFGGFHPEYYDPYDPSNGIMSHGFLYYLSPPAGSVQ